MGTLSAFFRLARAGRVLARHRALVPPEYADKMPRSLKAIARLLAPFGGKSEGLTLGARLAKALERLGPPYVKLGQFLATRPDIVGADLANALSLLQDRMPPFAHEEAVRAVEREFGKPISELFLSFGPCVAAASIAQVHKGEMAGAEGPRKVAVKVLRPRIEEEFAKDLESHALAARLIERFGGKEARRMCPVAVIETLKRSVALEMDMRLEAAAASEMAQATAKDEDFRVPEVVWERTGQRVLTTEWIAGTGLRDARALAAAGHDPGRIATSVVQNFLRQALRDGFFHADMHPGNLFVDGEGRLVAVDFGIMGRLSPEMRRFLAETLYGFLTRDYGRVAQIHFEVGFVPQTREVEDFAQALRSIGEPVFGRPASEISMAKLLEQLFEVTRLFEMKLQAQLVLLQKTMVVVEGVARELDPGHNIWESSRPVLEEWMASRVGPEARIRDAAESLSHLGRALKEFPQAAKNLETLAAMVEEGGVRLHPETARALIKSEERERRAYRLALWTGIAAVVILIFLEMRELL